MVDIISMSDDHHSILQEATSGISSYRASGGGNLLRDGAGVSPDALSIVARYGDIRTLFGEYIF